MKPIVKNMPFRRTLASCATVATLSWLSAFAPQAEAKEEWLAALPESTIAIISIKNTPELVQDWDKSGLGRFMADPAVENWLKPLYDDGVPPWDKWAKEELGSESFRAELGIYPGASIAAFFWPESDQPGTEPQYLSLSEMGDKKTELVESMGRKLTRKSEKDEELKIGETEIEGVTVHYIASGEGDDAEWSDSWAEIDDTLLETSSKKLAEQVIAALKGGSSGAPALTVTNMKRFQNLTGDNGDVVFYFDSKIPLEKLNQATSAAEAAGAGQTPPSPFNAALIIAALKPEELEGVGFSLDMKEGQTDADFALLHVEKPQGFLTKLFRTKDGTLTYPAFVPADAHAASVTRWSFLDFYDNLMVGLNGFGPMVGGMVQMQLGGIEQQLGIKIRDDLFATIDDEVVQLNEYIKGTANASQVVALKLKDSNRFSAALEAILKMAGGGMELFEETDYAGFKVRKIKASLAPQTPDTPDQQMAYTITGDYLLFSIGPPSQLHKVLNRLGSNAADASYWDNDAVKAALTEVPANATSVNVSDTSAMLKYLVGILTQAQGTLAKAAPKGGVPKGAAKGGEAPEKKLDPAATPDDAVFESYFGITVGTSVNLPDGVHHRITTKPPTP